MSAGNEYVRMATKCV